jgi:hypothetical protein
MAGKTDFSDQEWETLQKGVTGAGLMVTVADRGVFDTFKEAGALAQHLAEARERGGTPLIRELAVVRGAGFGATDSPEDVERETTEALRSSVATLQTKAPDDVQAYRDFVLDIAQSVAAAAKDVEIEETVAIEKISSALQ